jgi:hypothetical protein
MSGKVIRVTMFKIPTKESQAQMAENYKILSANAVKVFPRSPPARNELF